MARCLAPSRLSLAILGLLTLAALGATSASAQLGFEPRGDVSRYVPPRDDAGSWDGTWWYTSRDHKIALWIRTEDGVPQIKLRLFSLVAPEGFETDWTGAAEYITKIGPGTFRLTLGERDANTIHGTWDWKLEAPDSARIEHGTFSMHRTNGGRQMAFVFDELIRTMRRNGRPDDVFTSAPALTFFLGSKRQVLWDELPF
jgi:hypothetical protein